MRKDFAKAVSKGVVIKNQNFVTARGVYQIVFVRYENDIYFFKHRNGKLVECCNLSTLSVKSQEKIKELHNEALEAMCDYASI